MMDDPWWDIEYFLQDLFYFRQSRAYNNWEIALKRLYIGEAINEADWKHLNAVMIRVFYTHYSWRDLLGFSADWLKPEMDKMVSKWCSKYCNH